MKADLLYDKNAFLFIDDEENRIYIEGKKEKAELFEEFIEEYRKLTEERNGDYEDFYDELAGRLEGKMILKILDVYK